MSDLDLDLKAGEQRLGPYRLLRPISAGGMARVYEGRLDSLAGVSTRVAVKVIHPDFAADPGFQDLFVSEARISARLEHQNLVRVQQFNREGELLYLVMEFIEGFTLRKLISHARRNRLAVPTMLIAEMGRQACEGLHYAHTLQDDDGRPLGLVHRDVKPSNLMVNQQGVVKVLDFGISSAHGGEERAEGREGVKGTWGYMSLEQAHGDAVGPGADVFGLGAVLYELATGEALFPERDNDAIRAGLVDDEAARRAAKNVRADLAPVLIRALQRDPAARFSSAASFGRALGALVGDPLVAHESLVQLAGELRALEGSVQAGAQERARSVSTIASAGPGAAAGTGRLVATPPRRSTGAGLPISVGDAHGPRMERRGAPSAKPQRGALWAGALSAFGLTAIAIMAFAAWELYVNAGPSVPAAGGPPDLSALADPSGAAGAAVGSSPSSTMAWSQGPVASGTSSPGAVAPGGSTGASGSAHTESSGVQTVSSGSAATSSRGSAPPSGGSSSGGSSSGGAASVSHTVTADPDSEPAASAPAPTSTGTTAPSTTAPSTAVGYVSIGSEPTADVLIDGSFVKRTPMLRYSLSPGQHTVKLIAVGSDPKTFKVTVTSGQEARKIWNFETARWVDE